MAETIVAFVLEKIADALVKEVKHLRGVADEVEKVRRELDWIRAFLVDADRKQIEEERQKQWVREVREVAYSIEDVIDTFVCEVSQQIPGKRIFGGQPKALPVIHKLGNEIKQIQVRIQEITNFRERYCVNSLGEGSGAVKKLPVKPPVLPDIEDPDVIGLDEDRDNILKQLFDETTPRRRVVSIVGAGGLGKTTLAKKVYNRNMIQVTMRFLYDVSTVWCRIHDLLRDVAIQKAKEDNFLTVCSNQDRVSARRVTLHNSDDNKFMECRIPNLRTLLCFNMVLPDCSGHRLLKVLSDMGGLKGTNGGRNSGKDVMKSLQKLSHLRYLNINLGSIMWNQDYFETLISSMKFLQTLNLTGGRHGFIQLPDCIWHIKTLRHVNLPFDTHTMGPPPLTDLVNLQTLVGIKTRQSWNPATLPKMPNLRSLSIEITEGFPLESCVAFLSTLKKLEDLMIKGRYIIPIEVVDMRKFPFYQHLTFLEYKGTLCCLDRQMALETTMFPIHITRLSFWHCELRQDDLVALEKLRGLKWLELVAAYPNQTMRYSAGGFPSLLELYITDIKELEKWEIEEGAMPMLTEHCILNCPMLQVPQGLRHLTALRSFSWTGLQGESGCAKAKEIRNICKHVPSINFWGLDENSG